MPSGHAQRCKPPRADAEADVERADRQGQDAEQDDDGGRTSDRRREEREDASGRERDDPDDDADDTGEQGQRGEDRDLRVAFFGCWAGWLTAWFTCWSIARLLSLMRSVAAWYGVWAEYSTEGVGDVADWLAKAPLPRICCRRWDCDSRG